MDKGNHDFEAIKEEIFRQYDLQIRFDDSHDTKVGIVLGFIILVIGQVVFNKEFTDEIMKSEISKVIFFTGLTLMLISGLVGLIAYFTRRYSAGPSIQVLIREYREGKKRDFKKVISRVVSDAIDNNRKILEKKAKLFKIALVSFSTGFLVVVLSKIIGLVNLR